MTQTFIERRFSNRPNRVTPFGSLEKSKSRGAFLGNRGDLHAADGSIRRSHAVKAWICCTLESTRGQRVTFDTPGRYTPLFFWDEAVALAAGHRPCAQCRRASFQDFKHAYGRAKHLPAGHFTPVRDIDAELHRDRLDERKNQRRFTARLADLPSGTFVAIGAGAGIPHLLWDSAAYPWSHAGYCEPVSLERARQVDVLTPRLLVDVIRAGYVPAVRLSGITQASPAPV